MDDFSIGWQQEGDLASKSQHQLPVTVPSTPFPSPPSDVHLLLCEKYIVGEMVLNRTYGEGE